MLITHGNLTIRNATAIDAPQLGKWWRDGKVMAHAGFPNGLTTSDEEIADNLATDTDESRRLIIEVDSLPVGEMNYRNKGNHTAEIGIKICNFSMQEKGHGTKFICMLIDALFGGYGYEKIILDTNLNNKRAQHVYEKIGFRKVGERINSWKNQLGEPQSSVDYELTKTEYVPRMEKALEGLGAELYDQHETETDDVKFILDLIGAQPQKVLEVCCGSGRILVPLAKAGHKATGFDIDESMMDRIQPKAEGLENLQWRKADAVHDEWGSGFDVVVLAGNILFNIISNIDYAKSQELFIQKAAAALTPGGYVYIGYSPFAPNGRTLTRPAGFSCEDDGSIVWSWEGEDADGNYEKNSLTKGSFDEETGILKARRFCEQKLANGKVITEETEGIKHYATLEQIHGWLFNAGFIIEHEYEDFDKNPINDESRSVIIYAKKAEEISYVPINEAIEQKVIAWFGDGITKYDMLPNRDGCYRVAAMCGERVVGFTAAAPARWNPPLEQYGDAMIHSIEVDESFRRRGIGRRLITMLEDWARDSGYRQIRAWSSFESPEALHMWYAMGYAMCPAVEPIYENGKVNGLNPGYYYAKTLNLTPTK
jgi:RimJ/RimL family protein N-acetyltransferase